jgi:soluble lytic murein transglycosylase-like protein
MKKLSFFFAISCLLVINAFAQTRERRVFDNFDTTSGVQIVLPPQPAPVIALTKNTPKKLVKKTAQQQPRTANVQDGLGLQNVSQPLVSLSMSAGKSLGAFTTGDALIDSYIVESSIRYNVDPLLIYSQMHQESSFKRKAVSYKGASGLMQLMPATARRFGVANIFDPKQNIDAGVKYMRWLLNTFNQDLRLALAGYNAGVGAVIRYGGQIPPFNETLEYVRSITTR